MGKPRSENMTGILFGAAAYLMWGVAPIYWKYLASISAIDAIIQRVFWAAIILAIILGLRGRIRLALNILRSRRNLLILGACSILVAINWSVFVWLVMEDRILEASLGYYINPLISILIGFALLGEKINKIQATAIALAFFGVAGMVFITGSLPWPSLALAVTFAIYGLLRKVGRFVAMDALFLEMGVCVPFCIGITIFREAAGVSDITSFSPLIWLLLVGGGLVTFVPLWCFGEGVTRTSLMTIGLLQFVAPSMQFALAVLVYGEPFTQGHLFAFSFIWIAVAIYMVDMAWQERRLRGLPQSE